MHVLELLYFWGDVKLTLRVNVFKPLFGLSRDELSRLWERRSGQAGPSAYLTIGHGTDGLEVKAARSSLNGDGIANNEDAPGFIVDKRKHTEGTDDKGLLDKRCIFIPSSNGSVEFRYSGIGILGQICGSVNTLTGEVSTCYRALINKGTKIDLPETEVSPHLPEVEELIRLFNSHLSG